MPEDNLLSPRGVLQSFEQRFIDALQQSLTDKDRLVSGGLWQSIKASTKVFGQKVALEISMADYWRWVDEGRKAGSKQPPPKAMLKHIADRGERWNPVAQRISRFSKNKKGLDVQRKKPLAMPKARNTLAFLIGRSIKKHGIKPTHFATNVMEGNLIKEFRSELSKAVGREIKIEISKVTE